ncbi:hypothetical protein FACS189434_12920 [Bacteroidia bacterium]|nr:hypothetical protein FACS189434_12920 [Bacteroidia bacterium]
MKNDHNILEIGNKNPFRVPENYFENFAAAMEQKILAESQAKSKIIPLYRKIKPLYYIAAAVVLAFFVGDYLTMKTASDDETMVASQTETEITEQQSDVLLAFVDKQTLVDYYLTDEEE